MTEQEERYCPKCLMALDLTEAPRLLYCMECKDFIKYEKSLSQRAENKRMDDLTSEIEKELGK